MPFRLELTDDQKEHLFKTIEDDIHKDMGWRAVFDKRRESIYNAYRNRVKPKTDPWVGCSNSSIPIVTRAVDGMTAHTMETVAPRGDFSTIQATPISDSPIEEVANRGEKVGQYIGYYWRNRMNMADEWERFERFLIKDGNAFGKLWFERKFRNTRRIVKLPAEDGKIKLEAAADERFQTKDTVGKPMGDIAKGRKYKVREKTRVVTYTVTGEYDEDLDENCLLIEHNERVRNGPRFETIDIDNIHFSVDERCIEDVTRIHIRNYMSYGDIVSDYRNGRWNQIDDEGLEKLREQSEIRDNEILDTDLTPRTPLDTNAGHAIHPRQDIVEGQHTEVRPLEVWECFREIDIDEDGQNEQIVVWIELRTKQILRAEYLQTEYLTNEIPIIHRSLIPVDTRLLGIGVGEVLMPLLIEINTNFNNRNDANSLKLTPGGFYRPGSGFNPPQFMQRPGTWVQVDQPQQDVMPYSPQIDTRDSINIESFLLALAEDLSISVQNFGRQGSNAPRTARGTLALLQQDAIKLNFVLKRSLPALEKIAHLTVKMLAEHGDPEEEFRILGSSHIETIRKEDLDQRYDFYFDIDSISANREIQRQFASIAFNSVLPLAMQPPGSVPIGAIRLGRLLLKKLDIREMNDILPLPQGVEREPRSQDEEIDVMVQGIPVEPIMSDNHEEHIQVMDLFEQMPLFASVTPEWVREIWVPHKATHAHMLQEIQRRQSAMTNGAGGGGLPGPAGLGGGQEQSAQGLGGPDELAPEQAGSTFLGG